jgi:hypothetical protein
MLASYSSDCSVLRIIRNPRSSNPVQPRSHSLSLVWGVFTGEEECNTVSFNITRQHNFWLKINVLTCCLRHTFSACGLRILPEVTHFVRSARQKKLTRLYSILLGGEQFLTKLNEITGNCKFPATCSFTGRKACQKKPRMALHLRHTLRNALSVPRPTSSAQPHSLRLSAQRGVFARVGEYNTVV